MYCLLELCGKLLFVRDITAMLFTYFVKERKFHLLVTHHITIAIPNNPHFSQDRGKRQRGRGAEGKELVQELSPAPLHKRGL